MVEVHPYKTVFDEEWDFEWAADWNKVSAIFTTIDDLERQFGALDVSVLRELTQRKLILDLQKYAYSLSKVIVDKYQD